MSRHRFTESQPFDYAGYFAAAVQFLQKYQWIFCVNNTKFIREGTLNVLPREWIADLNYASNDEFNHIPLGYMKDDWSVSFREFLFALKQLQVQFDEHDCRHPKPRKGISVKKGYEIENLSSFIEIVRSPEDQSLVVDFGSGLGYLSELLHERFGLKVLGIESNPSLVETCIKRQNPSIPRKPVQYCHHFITEDSFDFIRSECVNRFGDNTIEASIAGLHACADLSITAIHCFLRCRWVQCLTIMPCCYHRMKEPATGTTTEEREFLNIPLSNELGAKLMAGGRNLITRSFLRLGCQQTAARWEKRTPEEHHLHGQAMFRRALIDAALQHDETVRVDKLKSTPNETTVENVLAQFTLLKYSDGERLECAWTDEHRNKLAALLEQYGRDGPRWSEYLECLQTCLQSVCENVILLDRMCYLENASKHEGFRIRRNLVRLRDDGLSPRCFIFHASKIQ